MTHRVTATLSATATFSGTMTATASPTLGILTATPSFTPTLTAQPSPVPGGGSLLIDAGVPLPNPNPRELAIHLQGPAEQIRLKVYSVAWVLIVQVTTGPSTKGW